MPEPAAMAPLLFDRAALAARRSRAAARVHDHDFLLARVADDFAERLAIVNRRFENALNIEAHHGLLSRRLRPLANIGTLTDAEPVAALRARCDGPVMAASADAPGLPDGMLDLVVSGLSLHLVDDLPGALVQLRRALKPDGLLLAALLGGETLHELRHAWLAAEEAVTGGASPRVAPFADVRAAGGLLQRAGFALPVVDSDTVTVTYESPLALMREIKGMGASNMLHDRRRVPVTRGLLLAACEAYAARFGLPDGRIPATFDIITLTGWVPDASQPQPLRPGSATTSLTAVLGAKQG